MARYAISAGGLGNFVSGAGVDAMFLFLSRVRTALVLNCFLQCPWLIIDLLYNFSTILCICKGLLIIFSATRKNNLLIL